MTSTPTIPTIPILIKEKSRMSYTPKTRQPQPAAAETAALSPALAAALERADELLAERNRTYAMVVETHYLYPDLLRQRADAQAALNAAELHGNPATLQAARAKFAEVETEARHALSRRNGGLEFLIGQERVLLQAQESLDSARGTYTQSAVAAFSTRYAATVELFKTILAEADALGNALRVNVPTPPPYQIEGGERPNVHPWPADWTTPKLAPIPSVTPPTVTLSPDVAKVGQALDGLASALRYVGGLAQHRRLEGQPPRATSHSNPDPAAVYIAQKDLTLHSDGLPITAGTWIDAPFMGFNTLARHRSVKSIIPVPSVKAEAAA